MNDNGAEEAWGSGGAGGGMTGGRSDLLEALAGHFTGGCPVDALPRDALDALGRELDAGGILQAELVAFWNVLEAGLWRAGYCRPEGVEIRLLNLACGPCVEGAVLASFFGRPGRLGGMRNKVRFFGMDLRRREIDDAKRRYEATERTFRKLGFPDLREAGGGAGEHGGGVEFFADDATRLVGYREIPQTFDITFLRHQNVWHDGPVWGRIFGFALDRLNEGGRMVITSYFDREHLIALELIKRLGGEVLVTLENPESRPLAFPGKSVDRHLAVIGRAGEV